MAEKLTEWSGHSLATAQVLSWIGIGSIGFGTSLQHYNSLIDEAIKKEWNSSQDWDLVVQMPFGELAGEPSEKTQVH